MNLQQEYKQYHSGFNTAMKITFLALLFFCVAVRGFSTDYYVSNTGNNSNAGTSSGAPFLTIAKALSVWANNDRIFLNKGNTFNEAVIVNRSGVSILAYGSGANPIITGFTNVTAWTNLGSNIWESTSAVSTKSTMNMVVINGVNTAMGRFPNTGYLTYQSFTSTSLTSSSLNAGTTNWTGAQAVVRTNNWVTERRTISSASGSTINYNSGSYNGIANYGFFIQNDVRTLDVQNEWYYNPSTKKIRVYSTSTPANVQVATIDTLVYLNGKNHVTLTGLDFKGSNIATVQFSASNFNKILNCNFDFAGINSFLTRGGSCDSTVITSCTINHTNNNAIDLGATSPRNIVSYNTVKNTGLIPGMGQSVDKSYMGINVHGFNTTVMYNTIDSVGYIACEFLGDNMLIHHNLISNYNMTKMDGGGIYTWRGTQAINTGVKIYNNIIVNASGSTSIAGTTETTISLVHGIYLDANTENAEVYNNTCANLGYSGAYFYSGTSNNNVHDNTFYNNGITQMLMVNYYSNGNPTTNNTVTNNIFFARTSSQKTATFGTRDALSGFTSILGSRTVNCYARPIDDNLTILAQSNSYSTTNNYNLAQWQTASSNDAGSYKSPVTVTNANQIFFYYNATEVAASTSVVTGKDVNNISYSGTTVIQPYESLILIQTASLLTVDLAWSPASQTYGTGLGAGQLNAVATSGGSPVPGTHVYTPGSGTVGNVPGISVTDVFTPANQSVYASATKTVTVPITPKPITGTVSNTSVIFNNTSQQPILTTSPTAGISYTVSLNGVTGGKINTGSYTYSIGINDPNYSMTVLTGTFTINPAPFTISVNNTTVQYDGTSKQVTVTTNPVGIATTISIPAKINVGSYSGTVSSNNSNYTATPVNFTLVITQGTTTVTWLPANLTYPTLTGAGQTNATSPKPGVYTYLPPSGTSLAAGSQQLRLNFVPNDTNIAPINNIIRTITVSKGTTTISVPDTIKAYDGSPKGVTPTVSSGTGTLTTLYGGSPTKPTNVGNYPFTVTYSDPNWQATTFSSTLHITSVSGSIIISNYLNRIYTGLPIVPTVTTPYSYTLTYSPSGHTNVGSNTVIATINDGTHIGADTVVMTIIKATPTSTWPSINSGIYPYVVTNSILNASSPIAGTWSYSVSVGDTLAVGTYTITGTFIPTNSANYNSITVTNTVVVNKGTDLIIVSDTLQNYDMTPKPITATTYHGGILTILYNGSATVPSAIGNYTYSVSYSGTNWKATTVTGILHIVSNDADIFISNYSNQVFTGSPISPVITSAYTYDLTFNGSATVPTNVGTYTVIATINDGIHTGADTVIMTIVKATPDYNWPSISNVVFPTALSGTQLNLTSSIPGIASYSPVSGTTPGVGTTLITATYRPTDGLNYKIITVTNSITVTKGVTSITVPSDTIQNYDGTPKGVTAIAGQSGTLTTLYGGSPTKPTAIGNYPFTISFSSPNWTAPTISGTLHITTVIGTIKITNFLNRVYTGLPIVPTVTSSYPYSLVYSPSNHTNVNNSIQVIATINDGIHIGADTAIMTIIKATPIGVWNNPSTRQYPYLLTNSDLNASSTTPGTWSYNVSVGDTLDVGSHNLIGTFTPTDGSNYNTITKTVTIIITKGTGTINLINASFIYDGTSKPLIVNTTPLNLDSLVILYAGSPTAKTNAGSYTYTGNIYNNNYNVTPISGILVIAKANNLLSWTKPVDIQENTPLSNTQLSATSNHAGIFIYNYPIGTKLPVGVSTLIGTFYPTDSVNYNTQTITTTIRVYGNPVKNLGVKSHGKWITDDKKN